MLECKVSISDIEPMKSLLQMASNMLIDDRIPKEYKVKILEVMAKN